MDAHSNVMPPAMKEVVPDEYGSSNINLAQAKCGLGQWVCGLRVKMDEKRGDSDDTALNQVIFKCCSYQKDVSKVYIPPSDDGGLKLI